MAKDKQQKRDLAGAKAASSEMTRKEFEKELAKLQVELTRLQTWVQATGARIIVVFEGRDTAGKGGVISRITARTSPRVYRHVALPAPSDREKTQVYPQRYIAHFPAAGEIVLFDRSWYNRAGIERLCASVRRRSRSGSCWTPAIEREIVVQNGIILRKYFLDISQDEQRRPVRGQDQRPGQALEAEPDGAASKRAHRGQELGALVARRRLAGEQGDHLEQMVLDHVTDGTRLLVELPAPGDAEVPRSARGRSLRRGT
jgi:polyphosphate kinase